MLFRSYKLVGGFAITLFYIFITFYYLHVTGNLAQLTEQAEEKPDAPAAESRAPDP